MTQYLNYFLFILLSTFIVDAMAQDYPIENGTVNTCEGLFLDDASGGFYSTDSYTFTICPDNPGDVIQVDFLAFSLWQSPNPNNSDRLYIFDGPDTGAQGLGSYTGTQMQNNNVTGTINNPTGCLTFVFEVNPNSPGTFPGWEADISCTTPCDTPTAASEISDPEPAGAEQSITACIGDEITFSDAGSEAGDGFTIETYVWNFGDGTIDETSGPVATHVYDEPGEYITTLTVIDNNGCASLNLDPLQTLISTVPIFGVEHDQEICLGSSANINANNIESLTWTSLPPQVVSGTTFLADGAGFTFTSELTFDFFEPGATLESCDDLLGVYVNMEHSYLGDLDIQIECPDGTTVPLVTYPNGGGGTYLGEPVDDGYDIPGENVPGIGYTYTWDPSATNGNLSDQPVNTVDFVTETGVAVSQNIVPEGTYQADGNLCDLTGCPLNGTWTFQITDNLGADNGYIFFWGLDINPEYFPDITTFTPVIGMGADSSFWSGPNLEVLSDNGNEVEFTPDATGDFDFTFSATNNFGCTQDTTITITVIPGPEADAGEDLVICEDSLQMAGGIAGEPPVPSECEYTLEMFDSFGDGWNGFSITVVEDGTTIGTYTINTGDENTATIPVTNGATIQLNTSSGSWDSEVSYDLYDAAGNLIFSDEPTVAVGNNIFSTVVDCSDSGVDIVYEWTPSDGLSNPNISDPMVMVDQNTTYTLTIWEAGSPDCFTTDEVDVTIPPEADPGQDNELTLCYNSLPFALLDSLIGDPSETGEWTDEGGNVVGATFTPADHTDGGTFTYTYTVTFGPCVKSAELIITVLEAGHEDCCQTFADAGADGIACDLTWELDAEPVIGVGTWSGPPGVTFANENDPNTTVTAASPGGVIELYWTDENGLLCEETDAVEVVFMDPVSATLNTTPTTCPDTCDGIAVIISDGGLGEYSYNWPTGQPGNSPEERTGLCPGEITVLVEDEYGCEGSVTATVSQTPRPSIDELNITDVTCYDWCDGRIEVVAPDAVSYSFDEGETFSGSPLLEDLCPDNFDIVIRDENGCENFEVATVNEPPQVEAEFSMNPSPANWTNTTIRFNNLSYPGPFTSTYWVFDTLNVLGTSTEPQPTFTFPDTEAGTYPISLCVENEAGCSACVSYDLVIYETLSLYVPNSFTPNEDGINDLFKAYLSTEHYSNYRMRIFNRYGELVFESNDPEVGWDGGEVAGTHYVRDEIFVYEVQVIDNVTSEIIEHKGHITVLR